MIRIILEPPVVPHKVARATGKKTYRHGDDAYCIDVRTIGELDTTTALLEKAGIKIEKTEDI